MRLWLAIALSIAGAIGASTARGQPAPAPAPAPAPDKLAEAKKLFRQANELRKIGDWQRALELYLASRALVPSLPNTLDAAICLDQLGRSDEALELYEELLTSFADDLDDDDRKAIASATTELRKKVGSLDVSANVEGLVVIDGRTRGKLPLPGPLRVMPGTHVVRVLRDGFETYEATITVAAKAMAAIDAKLVPLAAAGRLHIEGATLVGAAVSVDGANVGVLPWEGTLAPGPHVVTVDGGRVGTGPLRAVVIEGQTASMTVTATPLGPMVHVAVDPPSATLTIDGVDVGGASWQGRLPLGEHVLDAREEGYVAQKDQWTIDAGSSVHSMKLAVDPNHPRWAVPSRNHLALEAFVGLGLATGFGGGVDASCGSLACDGSKRVIGALGGARVALQFPSGVSLEGALGMLRLDASYRRVFSGTGSVDVTYAVSDALRVTGPFVELGVGGRIELTRRLELRGRLMIGGLVASASDATTGTATAAGDPTQYAVAIEGSGKITRSFVPFVAPEIDLVARIGGWRIGGGLSLAYFLVEGTSLATGQAQIVGPCQPRTSNAPCAKSESTLSDQSAFGRFLLWVPQTIVGYVF